MRVSDDPHALYEASVLSWGCSCGGRAKESAVTKELALQLRLYVGQIC